MKKQLLIIPVAAAVLLCSGCSMLGEQFRSLALDYDYSQMEFIQLEEPEEGRMAAVIQTSLGDITAVLYPEYAPKTVDNFVNRAKEGYYDNNNFFAVIKDCYAATGSSAKDGSDGVSNDGNLIELECTPKLWPFKGALCSFSAVMGYGDSRYFICNTVEFNDENLEQLRSITKDGQQLFPEELIAKWQEQGAFPLVSGVVTVFGQVVDGMDVFEEIMDAETDSETYLPKEEILVKHVEITEYKHKSQ